MVNLDDLRNKVGVYYILNSINGNGYVGSSVNLHKRLKAHFSMLRRGIHRNIRLQRAYNKYGEINLDIHILEFCTSGVLISREQYYIDTKNSEYNTAKIAGSSIGCKKPPLSDERRLQNSESSKRMWLERRDYIMATMTTPEQRRKKSESTTNVWKNPEYRKQHSDSLQGKGNSKLSPDDVREIRKLRKSGNTMQSICDKFGLQSTRSVARIMEGITYRWVED